MECLETQYIRQHFQTRSVLNDTDYTVESGVYNNNFFFVIIGLDYEHFFSIGNSLNEGLRMEFYHGETVPDVEVLFPDELTPDCYFNTSTMVDFHNVPLEFMKDAKQLYNTLEHKIGRKECIR